MKKIILLMFILFGLVSCFGNKQEVEENTIPNLSKMLNTCKSECGVDSSNYCLWEKTFLNNNNEITWTCRSFSKYSVWFPKCEWFCKQYWKNHIKCINGDWTVNMRCN